METLDLHDRPKTPDREMLRQGILDRHRRRLSRAEYHQMAEAGIFSEDDHIELIAGELVDMAPIGDEHAGLTTQLNHLLHRAAVTNALISVQSPLILDDHNEPEPDLLLLHFRPDYYKHAKPRAEDVLLLIEVADTSLNYDRSVKLPLYAQHRIPEVWIINLKDRTVEIHRAPDGELYRSNLIARSGDQLQPQQAPKITLSVANLLD